MTSPRAQMTIRLPPTNVKSPAAGRKSTTSNLEGWIEPKKSKRRQSTASAESSANKRHKASKKVATKGTKAKSTPCRKQKSTTKSKAKKVPPTDLQSDVCAPEIIDIDDESTSDEEPIIPLRPRRKAASRISREVIVEDTVMIDSDPDEEYEFEG